MKNNTIYVVDTPNIVRYKENILPRYFENYIALLEFIIFNRSTKFIVVVTPWLMKNLPNWWMMKSIRNLEFRLSSDYGIDPDVAIFEISKEISDSIIISNDKFRNSEYVKYNIEKNKLVGFEMVLDTDKLSWLLLKKNSNIKVTNYQKNISEKIKVRNTKNYRRGN